MSQITQMGELEVRDYLIHRGDTGEGEGVALIWLAPTCPIPKHARVSSAPGPNRNLVLSTPGFKLTLMSVERECFDMALTQGLHVIWQRPCGSVVTFLLGPKPG